MLDKDFLIDDRIKERLKEENGVIPGNIELMIKETGSKLSKRRNSTIIIKRVAAVFLALFIGVGVFGVTMPSYAKDIPIIGSIFKTLDKNLYAKYDEYSLKIGMSQESNGVKVTVNNVVYDGMGLCIDYTVEAKEPMKIEPNSMTVQLKVNGKKTMVVGTCATEGVFSSDKKTYRGMAEAFLKDISSSENIEIPEQFDLGISIKGMYDRHKMGSDQQENNEIAGVWNFTTQVTSEKSKGKVKEIGCNVCLDKLENGMKVSKLTLSPLNTTLEGINLKKVDGFGFIVYDDKERGLPLKTIASGSDKQSEYFRLSFKESYGDTKTLTFIPYILNLKENKEIKISSVDLNIKGETILPLGKYGDLRITKVDAANGETKVYYKCKYGSFIAPGRIIDKESGDYINIKSHIQHLGDKGEYVVTFDKALGNKSYTVQYQKLDDVVTIFDDLKFTIDINK